jgi:outer membrane protein assembly factor BamE (lipoprotein component of BamABCDE complex)
MRLRTLVALAALAPLAACSTVKEAATEESDSIPGQVFKPTMFD